MRSQWIVGLTVIALAAVVGIPGPPMNSGHEFDFGVAVASPDVCDCPCAGDPDCNGIIDIFDVVHVSDVALKGGTPPTYDPDCPRPREDYNCDDVVDIKDVVACVDNFLCEDPIPPCDPCVCDTNPAACEPTTSQSGSVVIESKQVIVNASDVEIGIYVANDVDIIGITLPLEIRQVTGEAFMANTYGLTVQGRVGSSSLVITDILSFSDTATSTNACSGPDSHSFDDVSSTSHVPSVPLDAVHWSGYTRHCDDCSAALVAGSDGDPGTGTPSFVLTFDVNGDTGRFEIDTCCVAPANHLSFVPCDPDNAIVIPSFTKGTVIVLCSCTCHGDPDPYPVCNHIIDVFDVVQKVDVAFRNGMSRYDPLCPAPREDVNCDGIVDVFDVVICVDIAFRSGPTNQVCKPCDCDPYPDNCP